MNRSLVGAAMVAAPVALAVSAFAAGASFWEPQWWQAAVRLAVLGGIMLMIFAFNIHIPPVFARRAGARSGCCSRRWAALARVHGSALPVPACARCRSWWWGRYCRWSAACSSWRALHGEHRLAVPSATDAGAAGRTRRRDAGDRRHARHEVHAALIHLARPRARGRGRARLVGAVAGSVGSRLGAYAAGGVLPDHGLRCLLSRALAVDRRRVGEHRGDPVALPVGGVGAAIDGDRAGHRLDGTFPGRRAGPGGGVAALLGIIALS